MGLMNLFKKEQPQSFNTMSRKEKKGFLANDLIERMIRIEQKLTGSFGGGFVPYYQTEYFKGLSEYEKNSFKKYLAAKEKRKKWRFLPWMGVILAGLFLSTKMTGNAIAGESIGTTNLLLAGIFILGILIYIAVFALQMHRWNRLERHFSVIEKIISKRRFKRD